MQTHAFEPEQIMAYLDGESGPQESYQIVNHLETCDQCRRLAEELKQISRELQAWEVESFEQDFNRELLTDSAIKATNLAELKASKSKARISLLWKVGAWAAVACLLLAVIVPNALRSSKSQSFEPSALWPASSPAAGKQESNEIYGYISSATPESRNGSANFQNGVIAPNLQNQSRGLRGNTAEKETAAAPSNAPMIVKTAELSLVSRDFDDTRKRIDQIISKYGGYLGQLSTSAPNESARSLNGTLRVPSPKLVDALAELKSLGRVETESQKGEEVTQQYVDLEARLANSRNTEARLTDILRNRTGKLSDVLEVEKELDRVRGELEEMEAERKSLLKQVAFASISISIREDYQSQLKVVPPSTGTRFRQAAVSGYNLLVDSLIEVALWLLNWSPTLLIWAVILFLPAKMVWEKLRVLHREKSEA